MILSEAEFHEASTLEQASELMGCWGAQAQLLAGGTNLLVDLKTDRFRTGHVISINRIAALRGISAADGGVRIGALTTINQLAASTAIRERFPAILDADTGNGESTDPQPGDGGREHRRCRAVRRPAARSGGLARQR